MITINNLTMGFTQRTLFKDVTLSIFPKEKIGLTGPNGAGKSTLFSIIRGEMESIDGNIQIQKNIHIGYLPQEAHFTSQKTVLEELTEGDGRICSLRREKRRLEDEGRAATDRYGDVLHELEALGIYELEHKAEKILSGLGFNQNDFDRPVKELSGGWQMRTLLAKLLVYPYDLLLLDEPTNYLDLEATLWLKDFLASYEGAFVLISHDRVFLNDVTNYTILLERETMTKVRGNYEEYEQQKEILEKGLERRQKVIEKKRQQLERFTTRFHAQPNRAAAVRNKRKMIDKLETIDIPTEQKTIGEFTFQDIPSSGYSVVRCDGVSKSYGEKQVYKNLDLEIIRGQKVCLVGPNGAGKSTLLKMLAGAIAPTSGEIRLGHEVERGYFSQTRLDVLSPNRSAMDEVSVSAKGSVQAVRVRTLLGLFNFHGDDVFKPVSVLSGGEKSRLILAKLLINPPNFMLLDEPTTHLDVDGIKALTGAFQKYTGTMCFISHDLFFIREVADCIIDVNDGAIKIYPGGLQYYLDKKGQDAMSFRQKKKEDKKKRKVDPKKTSGSKSTVKNAAKKAVHSEIEKLHQQHKQAKKRIAQIKKLIVKLENEAKELETESYVKARMLNKSYETRDQERIKEFGQRLKWIQGRQREIESEIYQLREENREITK